MAVFKDAGAVVTTPSSGTYVIECIGNVGVLADMIGARVREVGGDDAVRRVEEAFRLGSAEGTSSRPARGAKGSAAARAASKPKREPSKTKAAIAAAKRRARIKAEKLAAEEEAKRSSREALLRASRTSRASPGTSYDPAEKPLLTRRDDALDVEEDVAEAAEAMRGMIPAAPPSGLGLPPDADAAPAIGDGEEVFETREDDRFRSLSSEPRANRVVSVRGDGSAKASRAARRSRSTGRKPLSARCAAGTASRRAACAGFPRTACTSRAAPRRRTAPSSARSVSRRAPPRASWSTDRRRRRPSANAEKSPARRRRSRSGSAERRRAVASAEAAAAALAAARARRPRRVRARLVGARAPRGGSRPPRRPQAAEAAARR